jgi:hypothetical protein
MPRKKSTYGLEGMTPAKARTWLKRYGPRAKKLSTEMERFRMLKGVRDLENQIGEWRSDPWDDFDARMEEAAGGLSHLLEAIRNLARQ